MPGNFIQAIVRNAQSGRECCRGVEHLSHGSAECRTEHANDLLFDARRIGHWAQHVEQVRNPISLLGPMACFMAL